MYALAHPSSCQAPHPPRRILIHCRDGFVNTSLLALSYLICKHGFSLPSAYPHLQETMQRAFYVTPKCKHVLEVMEKQKADARGVPVPG